MKSFHFIFILVITVLTMSGCNPFGKYSVLDIFNPSQELTNQTTNITLNTGGSQTVTTNPPPGHPAHTVDLSVGNPFQQSHYVTMQGHTLEVMVIGVVK